MSSRKALFTLNVNDYSPEITGLTFPYLRRYADKIGAEFIVIKDRKFPDMPVTYEKLQIHELGKPFEWSIYFDADTLVHPDMFDLTETLSKDTVLHWGADMASNRWTYDKYFRRDGRHIGSGNWLAVASDWCLDLWKPLDDLTLPEALANIHPTVRETNLGMKAEHLIDDYVLSRNIAKYGLKFTSMVKLQEKLGIPNDLYLKHNYMLDGPGKINMIREHIAAWELTGPNKPGVLTI
jgi:hypothetical protein